MQRYLCILYLAATNKVISVEGAMRQSMPLSARYRPLRNGGSPAGRPAVSQPQICLEMQEDGDPGAIRTRDPRIRNPVLYPAELRGHPKGGIGRADEAPSCRATYVSSARAAISGNSGFSCIPLHCRAITPKYLGIRLKVNAGCMIHFARVQGRPDLSGGSDCPSVARRA